MPRYEITADVTVMLALEIEAESPDEARAMFDHEIAMTASLIGRHVDTYEITDDAIQEVRNLKVARL